MFQIAVALFVHFDAPADSYQVELFCDRASTPIGVQALQSHMGNAA